MPFARYPSLRDRVVFITGGGSGIGAAMVEAFVAQGASVAFVDIARDESSEVVERLAAGPQEPLFLECDLTNLAALEAAMEEARQRLGPIAVLVNNAANDAAPGRGRDDRGRLGSGDGRQPQAPVLRRADRAPLDARNRRRLDHQFFLDRLDDGDGAPFRLLRRQGRRRRPDEEPGARIRPRQYSRQRDRARRGRHRAPTPLVAQRSRRRCKSSRANACRAFCSPTRSRAWRCSWPPTTAA